MALGIVGSLALLIHFSSQTKAQASLPSNIRVSPLAVMADSMMSVTEGLDEELEALASKAKNASEELAELSVIKSEEARWLVGRVRELAVDARRGFPSPKPDPFLLNTRINQQQQLADELQTLLQQREAMVEHLPTGLPASGRFTSDFGYRVHPISGRKKMHKGIDIAARIGTPIYAPGSGTVIFAGWMGGYGNAVQIDHGFGYITLYAHASKLHVKEGDIVDRGDLIADIGSTGASTGPHLHYEVKVDESEVNPSTFLAGFISEAPQVAAADSPHKSAL